MANNINHFFIHSAEQSQLLGRDVELMSERDLNYDMRKRQSFYRKIFGCDEDSLIGPIFYLAMGILSLLVLFFIFWLGGSLAPGVLGEITDPPLRIPFIAMIGFLASISAIVGIIGGTIGITWFFIARLINYMKARVLIRNG